MRANESTSPTRAVIKPAGPIDRTSVQVVVGTGSSPGSWTCPTAVRCSNASSGSVTVPSSPSGSIRRSRSARSHVSPVRCSTIRPARTYPALQYENVAPSGWFCTTSFMPRT